jgi:hypothetical protein
MPSKGRKEILGHRCIGTCVGCGEYGDPQVWKCRTTGQLFIMCGECESTWLDPQKPDGAAQMRLESLLKSIGGDENASVEPANYSEISIAGWDRFLNWHLPQPGPL